MWHLGANINFLPIMKCHSISNWVTTNYISRVRKGYIIINIKANSFKLSGILALFACLFFYMYKQPFPDHILLSKQICTSDKKKSQSKQNFKWIMCIDKYINKFILNVIFWKIQPQKKFYQH